MYNSSQPFPSSYSTVDQSKFSSEGYNSGNQQTANYMTPVFGPRDTMAAAAAAKAAANPNQTPSPSPSPSTTGNPPAVQSANPSLPDWMDPQTIAQFQSMMQGYTSALPSGVDSASYDRDLSRAGGLSSLQNQQQTYSPSPYQGSDTTRLANDPFAVTSAARNMFR